MGAKFFNISKTRNGNDLILEKVNLECTKRAFFFLQIFIYFLEFL